MTCLLSFVILTAMIMVLCIQSSRHAALTSEDGNHINKNMANPLTSHILDTTFGKPAANVPAILYKLGRDGQWKLIRRKLSDEDGRMSNLIDPEDFTEGLYKIHFDTKTYYENLKKETFYPYVEIVFEIKEPQEHYHVPLLLSPFGYSTYRGS